MAFAANGEYIVDGGVEVGVWQVEDGKQMATLAAGGWVWSLAVSKDGRRIAAGTKGDAIVWDAKTFEKVFLHKEDSDAITGVDFSPDATRLLTASTNHTATILDVAARKKVLTLDHEDWVVAAKYSPRGDRIATATRAPESVRVWDSSDGRLLVDIPVKVTPKYNAGLLWSNNHLFVVSDSAIKQFEASTGSTVTEWVVPDADHWSCIALPKHGEFIAYSTNDSTVTIWNASTHARVGLIQHTQRIYSIALSPDDQFLATGEEGGKITVRSLPRITVSIVGASQQLSCSPRLSKQDPIPVSPLHPTLQEPDIQIDDAALDSWKDDQLENADALLTAAIPESCNPDHHVLASRALVRARLRHWDAALVDAQQVLVAPVLTYAGADDHLHQGHRNSAVCHWLHREGCGARRQRGQAWRLSGLRHRIRTFPFVSR